MRPDLLSIDRTDHRLDSLLGLCGRIRTAYLKQDSGCVSYVVERDGRTLFVKGARTKAAAASLRRAEAVHAAVRDNAFPPLLNAFRTPEGPVHVYAWVPGEVLYDYVRMNGEAGRRDPASAHARFRALPVERILASLDVVFALHERIAEAGFVAVDFYDGCILYDFVSHRTWVCDLDEYRPGPFRLREHRLPGSRRFMAPEESMRGATIAQRTNVYTLARAAAILLSDGDENSAAWRGTERMRDVVRRATAHGGEQRFPTVGAFFAAWRAARRQPPT